MDEPRSRWLLLEDRKISRRGYAEFPSLCVNEESPIPSSGTGRAFDAEVNKLKQPAANRQLAFGPPENDHMLCYPCLLTTSRQHRPRSGKGRKGWAVEIASLWRDAIAWRALLRSGPTLAFDSLAGSSAITYAAAGISIQSDHCSSLLLTCRTYPDMQNASRAGSLLTLGTTELESYGRQRCS